MQRRHRISDKLYFAILLAAFAFLQTAFEAYIPGSDPLSCCSGPVDRSCRAMDCFVATLLAMTPVWTRRSHITAACPTAQPASRAPSAQAALASPWNYGDTAFNSKTGSRITLVSELIECTVHRNFRRPHPRAVPARDEPRRALSASGALKSKGRAIRAAACAYG